MYLRGRERALGFTPRAAATLRRTGGEKHGVRLVRDLSKHDGRVKAPQAHRRGRPHATARVLTLNNQAKGIHVPLPVTVHVREAAEKRLEERKCPVAYFRCGRVVEGNIAARLRVTGAPQHVEPLGKRR